VIRTIWMALNLFWATLILGSTVIVAGLFHVRGNLYWWCSREWARWLLWATGCRVRVEGREHIALDRPQVFASNHVSHVDVIALAAHIPKPFRFVAKKELAGIPVFGQAWRVAGHISVDRSDRASAVASLDAAGRLIREDKSSVVIFPEGTRGIGQGLLPFKKGAFMLALRTGVEIVPAAVIGTRAVLPKGAWRLRAGPVIVRFGAPIDTTRFDEDTRDVLIDEVRARIEQLLEAPPAGPRPDAGADPLPSDKES
jgi:1-acyl-sn-glycerol-3-phosphate acyltransferase